MGSILGKREDKIHEFDRKISHEMALKSNDMDEHAFTRLVYP